MNLEEKIEAKHREDAKRRQIRAEARERLAQGMDLPERIIWERSLALGVEPKDLPPLTVMKPSRLGTPRTRKLLSRVLRHARKQERKPLA